MSSEDAAAVARVAIGDVSPTEPVERVSTTRPFAYHGDVVDAGYVRLTYGGSDFGDHWSSAADIVADRLRAAGWSVRTHQSFFLDDPAYVDVAATRGTTAVLVEVDETSGLTVDVRNVAPARLMPLTLLGGVLGLALGGLLGAGPIARRFGRAGGPHRWWGLVFGALLLVGLAPGAILGLVVATWSWFVDARFARPFWSVPAAYLSNGDPIFVYAPAAIGLIGLAVTLWRSRPAPARPEPA